MIRVRLLTLTICLSWLVNTTIQANPCATPQATINSKVTLPSSNEKGSSSPSSSLPEAILIEYGKVERKKIAKNQKLRYRFAGQKDDVFLLTATVNYYSWLTVLVFDPKGNQILYSAEKEEPIGVLPSDGIYTIIIQPDKYGGNFALTVMKLDVLPSNQTLTENIEFLETGLPKKLYVIRGNEATTLDFQRISGTIDLLVTVARILPAEGSQEQTALMGGPRLKSGTMALDLMQGNAYLLRVQQRGGPYLYESGKVKYSLRLNSKVANGTSPALQPD